MILMPGLRRDQLERGLREVRVSEADVRRNVASVTEEDAVAFMKLGALPCYSVALVRWKRRVEAALLGVDEQAIRKARGTGRLLFVDKRYSERRMIIKCSLDWFKSSCYLLKGSL